jgi:putative endopeptidase
MVGMCGIILAQIILWAAKIEAASAPDVTSPHQSSLPGDNFYRFANGHWLDTQRIPADGTDWNPFEQLSDVVDARIHKLIGELPRRAPSNSIDRKIGDYYRAFLDQDTINSLGIKPAQPTLQAIAQATTYSKIARLMGRQDLDLNAPVKVSLKVDDKNTDRYLVVISQSGLALPDRDYYLSQEAYCKDIRKEYQAHVAKMLVLAGERDADQQARQILSLETEIASGHWPPAKLRQAELTYNLRSLTDLQKFAPTLPWTDLLEPLGVANRREFKVAEVDAIEDLGRFFTAVPIAAWQSYLKAHYLDQMSSVLPKAFDDEAFNFYGRKLNGQQEQRDRWRRGVAAVNDALGEAIGKIYVEHYFSSAAKTQASELVENVRAAYGTRIQDASWLTEQTKKSALAKLTALRSKIGYPDRWRDYSSLEVRKGDAFGNQVRARIFEWQRQVQRIDGRTDREEWPVTPQTVTAYNNSTFNEIVVPAAILQPPFFRPKGDVASNYGAIGAFVGHEMSHSFDDQGANYDDNGDLRAWWLPQDKAAFKILGERLAAQYDAYDVLPGVQINGELTLGENIADLSGLSIAYDAYRESLHGKPFLASRGFSGDERFFLAWARSWRSLIRNEALRTQVSDEHSPPQFRVDGVVRNMDAWYTAFHVQPGDRLYLSPENRVRIW